MKTDPFTEAEKITAQRLAKVEEEEQLVRSLAKLPKIEAIDTSTWTEFPTGFFDKPEFKSHTLQIQLDYTRSAAFPCVYVAAVRTDKEEAIEALRQDLAKLANTPEAIVEGFLAKPSVMKLEVGGEKFAAVCYVHGFVAKPLGALYMELTKTS